MEKVNLVSFPGLGIGPLELKPVAFTLFGRPIAWYGIIITCGVILAVLYARSRARAEKLQPDDVLDYAIYCVFFGVICARAYYVAMRWDVYHVPGNFLETLKGAVAVWEGGLAIYGGIIGGAITALIVAKCKKQNILQILDVISPGVLIGQLMGRWGNFVNAEAYGAETALPWRMGITVRGVTTCYHPTFLYESLWNLLGFLLLHLFYKNKKYHGQIFLMYATWYGFGRMFIEGLRTDSLYVGSFRISQVVAFFCFLIGGSILVTMAFLTRKAGTKPLLAQDPEGSAPVKDEESNAENEAASGEPDDQTEKGPETEERHEND